MQKKPIEPLLKVGRRFLAALSHAPQLTFQLSKSKEMKCTLCGSKMSHLIDDKFYDCPNCRALIKDPRFVPNPQEEHAHYLTHNNDVNDPRYQRFTMPITQFILKNRTPEHHGLDYGAGTGPVISKMLQDKGYSIEQYDPYFAPNAHLLSLQYDYIVACEVIEHFYEPQREFAQLSHMLKSGGYLVCMSLLYEGEPSGFANWFYRKDPTHVSIYRKETIGFIGESFGMESQIHSERLITFRKPHL